MVAAVVVAVAIVAAGAVVELGALPVGGNRSQMTTSLPIVDVVMPLLGTSGNLTNPNRVVNMSLGETQTFEVDVYPTVGLVFEMSFRSLLVSGSSGAPSGGQAQNLTATFQPASLSVGANGKGVTEMSITVPANAAQGTYDVVVSATSQGDPSQVWGLYFEVSVS